MPTPPSTVAVAPSPATPAIAAARTKALAWAPNQITVTHEGETRSLSDLSSVHSLRQSLALAFDLLPEDLAGLAHGRYVLPLSFVCNTAAEDIPALGSETEFTLLVHQFDEEEKTEEEDAVIAFTLSPTNLRVIVTQREGNLLHFVRNKTMRRNGLPPSRDELEATFAQHMMGEEGTISKQSFDHLVRALFPQMRDTAEEERKALSSSLSRIFFAFDRDGRGEVLGRDLFTAFGVLLSKHGLEFAFQLADANGDGFVDKHEFFTFTRSFLTLVLALNGSVSELSARQVSACIDATAVRVLQLCFAQADINRDELLTWGEFSHWYAQGGGHEHMPWIRLMVDAGWEEEEEEELAKQQMDSTVYEFRLAWGFGPLRITQNDVNLLEHLLVETRLFERELGEVIALFLSRSDHGLLSIESYNLCLRRLLGPSSNCGLESMAMLQNIFFAFDRNAFPGHVSVAELCTGFALLLRGSKSSKLQLTFALFEEERDAGLTVNAFVRFLRSVLTILFALNEGASLMTAAQVFEMVDATCIQVTRAVKMAAAAAHQQSFSNRITFQDFADYYNTGSEFINFVELLDLSKFPMSERMKREMQQYVARPTPPPPASLPQDKREFSFELPLGRLELLKSDSDAFKRVVDSGNFAQLGMEDLIALASARELEVWTKPVFDSVVGELSANRNFFDKVFAAFAKPNADDDGEQLVVEARQIVCALSFLLGVGKKSDKLALGFSLFQIRSQRDLTLFFQSYLLMLFLLTKQGGGGELSWDCKQTVWHLCLDLADRVGGGLEFEDFAQWYGKGGYKVASFLELLDQSKWPFNQKPAAQTEAAPPPSAVNTSVFVFSLTKTDVLVVSTEDLDFVRELVRISGLRERGVEDLLAAFASVMRPNADDEHAPPPPLVHCNLTLDEFIQALVLLRVGQSGIKTLLTLFEVCDRAKTGLVKFGDVLGGLVLLCGKGNKSSKLVTTWNAFARQGDGGRTEDALLQRTELYLLFRSLLVGLYAFNLEANSRAMAETFSAVDGAATLLTANVFLSAQRKRREVISFEEFADFYSTGGGYQLVPWLELLNLPKFIGSAAAAPAAAVVAEAPSSLPQKKEEEANQVVFHFALGGANTEEEDVLIVTRRDIDDFGHVLEHSKLSEMDAETMARIVAEFVKKEDGMLTERTFGEFVGEHVVKMPGPDAERVARALHQLFESFDYDASGAVEPASLCLGLSLLTLGSKSAKLSIAWSLFSSSSIPTGGVSEDDEAEQDQAEEDDLGGMDRARLAEFLRALLTSVSCFAGMCLSDDVLEAASKRAAHNVFADMELDEEEEITFEEFASWYTNLGFETLSWIELLSNAKWSL